MPNLFDDYLQKVGSYLRTLPPSVREGELREIEGHLQQLSADLESEGHASAEAATLALQRFGTARAVGIRLRDVWEQNRGPVVVGLMVLAANYLTLWLSLRLIWRFFFGMMFENPALTQAIAPVFIAWMAVFILVQPLLCNFLCGCWGGRRAVLSAIVAHLPLFLLCLTPLSFSLHLAGHEIPLAINFVFMTGSAALGAYLGTLWRRRVRFGLVSGPQVSFEEASLLLKRRLSIGVHLRPVGLVLLLVASIGGTGFWIAQRRMHPILHPPTPEKAVQVLLSNPGFNFGEMAPSTDVSVRVLPPQTPAEKAGVQRRVAFSARMHATPHYRKRRREFLEKQVRVVQEGRVPGHRLSSVRTALARLRPDGYQMKGVLPVRKTPDGWQVDNSNNSVNRLWAWLYDIYYEEPQ